MEFIIIACVLGYLFVSPDKKSLALSRGLTGMARGAITGKSPKDRKTKKRQPSPRQRAMLDGWREGVKTARERREAGKDLWSRGTRVGGRVAGGTGSLARGIKTTIAARRARSVEVTDPAPGSVVVDEDGHTVDVTPDAEPENVPAEDDGEVNRPIDLDTTSTKLCSACKEVPVKDGEICGQCQFRQKIRDRHNGEQDEPIVEPDPSQRDCRNCPGDGRHSYDQHCAQRVGPWPRIGEDQDVTVLNPDEPFGAPSYNGDPIDAHHKLDPGIYPTTDPDVALVVTDHSSALQRKSPITTPNLYPQSPGTSFPDARNDDVTTPGPVIGSDFHQSTTNPGDTATAPIGEMLMSIAKTELNHLDDLDAEVQAVQKALAGMAEAVQVGSQWGADLPERYQAAQFATKGIDQAVEVVAETLGALKFPDVDEAMANLRAKIAEARTVTEVVDAHGARGAAEAFASR